MNSGDYQED